MQFNILILFFKLSMAHKVVLRALKVAIVVGVVLNLINQFEPIKNMHFSDINGLKFLLTFMVPYMVSTYSSVMAKLNFEVGEIAPLNAILRCKKCDNKILHINKGEVVPECKECPGKTKWKIIKKGVATAKKLPNQHEAMALFAEYNPAPVFRFDKGGRILMSNPASNHFFEKPTIENENINQLAPEFSEYDMERLIEKGKITSLTKEIHNRTYRFEMRGIPKLGVCQVYGADITQVLAAKFENKKFLTAIEQTSNSIMITDTKGNIEFVNQAFVDITGYSITEVIGKNPRFLKTNYLSDKTYHNMWKTIASGKVWRGEFHNKKKNGETYWEEATISPVKNEKGKIVNYMSVKEDITAKKEAQKELHSMALFAELNPEPVFRFNQEGIVMKANPAANKSFKKTSIEGERFDALFPKLVDFDYHDLITHAHIKIIEEEIGDHIYRFILRGLPQLGVCQIYGSNVTLRRKAEQKVLKQKQNIEQSIRYASRIQDAVLPSIKGAEELLKDHFILFKPRDIVSGDFYWVHKLNNQLILIAADCTGHGVPGAFMSMLGISFLNEIVVKQNKPQANVVLNKLREKVISTLSNDENNEGTKDGMDMALCIIDFDEMKLQYAGAYNPLIMIRKGEMLQYKADKMPIGSHIKERSSFTNHEIAVEKEDVFYIYSDGYADQFGGEKGSKFSSKALKALLLKNHSLPMIRQKQILDETFYQWKGENNQLDDIIVIGAKI